MHVTADLLVLEPYHQCVDACDHGMSLMFSIFVTFSNCSLWCNIVVAWCVAGGADI